MNIFLIVLSLILFILTWRLWRIKTSPFYYILTGFGGIISFIFGIYSGGEIDEDQPIPCIDGSICQPNPSGGSTLTGGCFGTCCGITKTITTQRKGTVTCSYPNFVCPYGTKINGVTKYCLEFDPTAKGNEKYFTDCFTAIDAGCNSDENGDCNPNTGICKCFLQNNDQITRQYDVQPECNAVSYGGAQDSEDAKTAGDCLCKEGQSGGCDKTCYFGPSGVNNMRFTAKMACMLHSCARSNTGELVTSSSCSQNGDTITVPVPKGGGCGAAYLPSLGGSGLFYNGNCYDTGLYCPVTNFPYIWRNGAVFSLYTEPDHSASIISKYTISIDWYCGIDELPKELQTSDVEFLYIDQTVSDATRFVVTNYNKKDGTFNLFDAKTGYYLETYPKAIYGCNENCVQTCDSDYSYDLLLFRAASKKSRYKIVSAPNQSNPLVINLIDTSYNSNNKLNNKTNGNGVIITSDAGGTVKDAILPSTNKSSIYGSITLYISIKVH